MDTSTLRFVNHASFVVDAGDTRLLCDPWLKGSAFNHGWDLLSPVAADPFAGAGPTHLWFSHEHPDHFSVPTLVTVPEAQRAQITVLFQRTADHRVATWCRRAGFVVRELDDGECAILEPGTTLTLFRNGTEDSAVFVQTPATSYLNLNDCMFESRREMARLARRLPARPDVLLSQFSYAEGIGGPDDTVARHARARYFMDRFFDAVDVFEPTLAVPFAGFKVFGHEENAHHNDAFPIRELAADLRRRGTGAALLYPGDEVVGTTPVAPGGDVATVAERYHADLVAERTLRRSGPSVDDDALVEASARYLDRLRSVHPRRALQLLARAPDPLGLPPTRIELWDTGSAFTLSPTGGLRAAAPAASAPATSERLRLHSESLQHWFDQDFGASTLLINGRFEATPAATSRLYRWSHLGLMTAGAQPLSLRYAAASSGRVLRTLAARRTT